MNGFRLIIFNIVNQFKYRSVISDHKVSWSHHTGVFHDLRSKSLNVLLFYWKPHALFYIKHPFKKNIPLSPDTWLAFQKFPIYALDTRLKNRFPVQ